MRYVLRSCRSVNYLHEDILHNFAIEIPPYLSRNTFRISVYSSSKMPLKDDDVIKMIKFIFKDVVDLTDLIEVSHKIGYERTRRSLEINIQLSAYHKVYRAYMELKKCYVYDDKHLTDRQLKCFNNVKVAVKDILTTYNMLYQEFAFDYMFFNGELISEHTTYESIMSKIAVYNSFGLYANDNNYTI